MCNFVYFFFYLAELMSVSNLSDIVQLKHNLCYVLTKCVIFTISQSLMLQLEILLDMEQLHSPYLYLFQTLVFIHVSLLLFSFHPKIRRLTCYHVSSWFLFLASSRFHYYWSCSCVCAVNNSFLLMPEPNTFIHWHTWKLCCSCGYNQTAPYSSGGLMGIDSGKRRAKSIIRQLLF